MLRRRALPPVGLLACWVLILVGVAVMWRLLPTGFSQLAILVLVISSFISGWRGNVLPTVYASALLGLSLINYGQALLQWPAISATAAVFVLMLLITTVKNRFHEGRVGQTEQVLLAFFIAQVNSITSLWPISSFNRSLLTGIAFYVLWHIFEERGGENVGLGKHFVFAVLAAILVIGSIIWANFPQLLSF